MLGQRHIAKPRAQASAGLASAPGAVQTLAIRARSRPLIPANIHQTTSRARLTWEERRLAARLRRLSPGWRYRLWRDPDALALMQEQFPTHVDAYQRLPRGVMRADVARYAFLHAQGGWYFDTDYKLLRPIGPELMQEACIVPLEYDSGDPRPETGVPGGPGLGNAVIASASGHPFWRDLIDHVFAEVGALRPDDEAVVETTGPGAVTRFFFANRDRYPDIVTPPRNQFHPRIRWLAMRSSADARTYGVHLNWGGWRGRSPAVAARVLLRRKLNAL